MIEDIKRYNEQFVAQDFEIVDFLFHTISNALNDAECKVWHGHPVWFIAGNPIVGYSKQKKGIRLMFWSGVGFDEPELNHLGGKFKDASIFYNHVSEVNETDMKRWLMKSREIQWDYKNIVKRKGKLERI